MELYSVMLWKYPNETLDLLYNQNRNHFHEVMALFAAEVPQIVSKLKRKRIILGMCGYFSSTHT